MKRQKADVGYWILDTGKGKKQCPTNIQHPTSNIVIILITLVLTTAHCATAILRRLFDNCHSDPAFGGGRISSDETLHGVYTERSECVQGDKGVIGQQLRYCAFFLLSYFLLLTSNYLLPTSSFLLLPSLYATTPHTITIDGDLSDWHEDELIYDDSQNDSPWGIQNELHKLYLTWDGENLYIGVSGVQKDGNNLLVYIDTSPFSGITDASLLKDPGNPVNLWWWRRGNKFPQNFRPDFQWHMYEMRLNTNEGHGLFRVNPDNTTVNLNSQVEQKSSGGGAGNIGYAEIKIPWSVLYDAVGFPTGEEIRIVAMVTGGMDMSGNWQSESWEKFGSARDTIPDQRSEFPRDPWYAKFTIDTWLAINLSEVNGRSPIPRKLEATAVSSDSIKLKWLLRGVVERKLSGFNLYYSTDNASFKSVRLPSIQEYVLSGLSSNATYFFYLKAIYGVTEGGKSETVSIYLSRPSLSHTPMGVFGFPGRKMDFKVAASAEISSAKLFYRFGGGDYQTQSMTINGALANTGVRMPLTDVDLEYYFAVEDISGEIHTLPYNAPKTVFSTKVRNTPESYASPSAAPTELIFGGGVKICLPAYSMIEPATVYQRILESGEISFEETSAQPVILYEFYTLNKNGDKAGLLFNAPATLTLRYFDEDLGSYDAQKLAVYRIDGRRLKRLGGTLNTHDKTISVTVNHLSKYGIFYEQSTPAPSTGLKKVVRPIFNPSLNEVVEFDVPTVVSLEIFDLNGRKVSSSGKNFWDGRSSSGDVVLPGVYVYKLDIGSKKIYGSCVVVR